MQKLDLTAVNISRPVHSSPGFNVIGLSTAAPSTHSMLLYSSSPKSAIVFDFFSHGFHTTAPSIISNESYHMQTSNRKTNCCLIHTGVWKSFLSDNICSFSFMVKNCNYLWRSKVSPVHLNQNKHLI